MLFKKKDNAESSKAKTSLFAKSAKGASVAAKEPVRDVVSHDEAKQEKGQAIKASVAAGKANPNILVRPHITEKAGIAASSNIYVFAVAPWANKKSVESAIIDVYKVTPVKVRITAIPRKRSVNRRGMVTMTGGGKKAYVYLKQGDTIELV